MESRLLMSKLYLAPEHLSPVSPIPSLDPHGTLSLIFTDRGLILKELDF